MSIKDNSYGIAPLQDKMLDILKYFISVCEKYNLRYFAGGGTCLGALRHQGFIPWDDDVDVFMPRPDYEKLWALWQNNPDDFHPGYKLTRTGLEKNYHHRVMQMVDVNTTFVNKKNVNEDIEQGVYIDILPIDAAAPSYFGKLSQAFNACLFSVYNVQCLPNLQGGKLMRTATNTLLSLMKSQKGRYKIWKHAEKRMVKCDWDSAAQAVELTAWFKNLMRHWPMEWFETTRPEPFEDIEIQVPVKAEEYMTAYYGDYMQLPPEESRTLRHDTMIIDLEHSYTEYKGKAYCKD